METGRHAILDDQVVARMRAHRAAVPFGSVAGALRGPVDDREHDAGQAIASSNERRIL